MEGYTVGLKGNARQEGESQEQYRKRRKLEKKAIKRYLAGQTLDLADGPEAGTHWLERVGTGTRVRRPVSN